MKVERYAVADVETTGFGPTRDNVVEIGCVPIDGDAVVYRWETLVNPGIAIPEHATAIHGITNRMVAAAPDLGAALTRRLKSAEARQRKGEFALTTMTIPKALGWPASADNEPALAVDRAKDYANAAQADNTCRAYRAGWNDFSAYCARHYLAALPASPQTVAVYVTQLAGETRHRTPLSGCDRREAPRSWARAFPASRARRAPL